MALRFRNADRYSNVMNPMNASATTDDARLPPSDAGPRRAVGWIAVSSVLFVILLLGTLLAASRLTIDLGIADPEREHFALIQALLFGASLLVAVPLAGRLLGQAHSTWPGMIATLPFLLAAAASYLLFEDVRSGHLFDTDHALPEIFVPLAVALLGSAHLASRVAATDHGRRAWSWFSVVAAVVLLAVVALTFTKATAGLVGMFQIDSPLTFAVLAAAAAYGLAAIGHVRTAGGGT